MRSIAAGKLCRLRDIAVIGGGVSGCRIARDAAGRGWSSFPCEKGDLASATARAAGKLIHGGLRCLDFVRAASPERESLWRIAPHIIRPRRSLVPRHKGLRPAWLPRLGLFLDDHRGAREFRPATKLIRLGDDAAGAPLKPDHSLGFEYSDCRMEDSRPVVLDAIGRRPSVREIVDLVGATLVRRVKGRPIVTGRLFGRRRLIREDGASRRAGGAMTMRGCWA